MIVVVSIIAVLASILLPALGGANRRSRKTEEINQVRQIGVAWNLYANTHNGAALPGFLPPEVQESWNVTYRYANRELSVDPVHAAPWTLRLARYIDFNHDLLLGYRPLQHEDPIAIDGDLDDDGSIDFTDPAAAPGSGIALYEDETVRPATAAYMPAFGYNAYYVGGWWRPAQPGTPPPPPFPRYAKARRPGAERTNVVIRTSSGMSDPSKLVLFSSSTAVNGGVYKGFGDDQPGMHYVIPRYMDVPYASDETNWPDFRKWAAGTLDGDDNVGTDTIISVFASGPDDPFTAIPIGRHTGLAATVHADLHTEPHLPGELDDMRYWVNGARGANKAVHTSN